MTSDPASTECLPPHLQRLATTVAASDGYATVSVAASTLAVGLNLTQILVVALFACSWKSAYYFALCFCGLLSATALQWHVVSVRMPQAASCGAVPSALSIAVLVGYTAHSTAPIIHYCIADTWPRAFVSRARNRGLCILLSGFAWCETALLAVAVLSDWPSLPPVHKTSLLHPDRHEASTKDEMWDSVCALPHLWSSTFFVFVSILYFLHILLDLVILADMTIANRKQERSMEHESTEQYRVCGDLRPLWTKFFLLILGTSPFVATMLYQSSGPLDARCTLFRDSLPAWTLVSTVMLGIALPLVHVFSDEVVAGGSVHVLRKVFCCACRRGARVMPEPDRVPCHQRF